MGIKTCQEQEIGNSAQTGSSKTGYLLAYVTELVLGAAGSRDSSGFVRTQRLADSAFFCANSISTALLLLMVKGLPKCSAYILKVSTLVW